jgi:hypothetical protein
VVGNFDREAPQTMHPRRAIVPPTRRPAPWGFTVVHVKTLRGTETADAVDPPQTAAVEGHRYRDPRGDGYITYFSAIRYSSARKSSVGPNQARNLLEWTAVHTKADAAAPPRHAILRREPFHTRTKRRHAALSRPPAAIRTAKRHRSDAAVEDQPPDRLSRE